MNTPPEIFLIDRLAQVTNDAIRQRASPVNVIGVGSNEDCRKMRSALEMANATGTASREPVVGLTFECLVGSVGTRT